VEILQIKQQMVVKVMISLRIPATILSLLVFSEESFES